MKPPTQQEVIDYCTEKNSPIDPVEFWNFYEMKGWYVGKTKMQNWHCAIATWERRKMKTEQANVESWRAAYVKVKAAALRMDIYDEEKTREALNSLSRRERHCLKACGGSSRFKNATPDNEPQLRGAFRDLWGASEE